MPLKTGLIAICLLFCPWRGIGWAAGETQQQVLDSLRLEFQRVDSSLAAARTAEDSTLIGLDAASRRITLLEELIRRQVVEIAATEDSISAYGPALDSQRVELARLDSALTGLERRRNQVSVTLAKTLMAERRLESWASLEFLLGSNSWRDLRSRRWILERLDQTGRLSVRAAKAAEDSVRTYRRDIQARTDTLDRQRKDLERLQCEALDLTERSQTDIEHLARQKTLLSDRLELVRLDQRLLTARRDELAEARSRIEALIARITPAEPAEGPSLLASRGRLPWPCSGRLAQRYGLVRNRSLETVTDNPGIELITESGVPVNSIADGRISSVTWLRGFGNVCIVEHPGTYYTVYAKLGEVLVHPEQAVPAGAPLGYAGYDANTTDYRVHFEIWAGREKKDPLDWLSPQ